MSGWPGFLLFFLLAAGCGGGEEAWGIDSGGLVRVASFNLLHDWPNHMRIGDRLEMVVGGIRAAGIDVVGIQEASVTPEIGNSLEELALKLGYYDVYAKLEGSYDLIRFESGNGGLSRFPIVEKEVFRFPHQDSVFENRSVVGSVIASPRGPFTVFSSLFLDNPAPDPEGELLWASDHVGVQAALRVFP